MPGVRYAGVTSQLPLIGDHDAWGVHFESPEARIGQRLRVGPYDSEPITVVGIVGDVTHETLAAA